jgi:catechol 2,3-dioxygenase-like lactoylglutathione lyase family enzyme
MIGGKMKLLDVYPLITTTRLNEARDFYVTHFAMHLIFQASWVVMLGRPGSREICLGFMATNHPTSPPGPEAFDGRGMIVTIAVADAAQAHAALRRQGAPIYYELCDEPWGQRHFMTRDPAGTIVDVVEQIEPAPGYWEKYLPDRPD